MKSKDRYRQVSTLVLLVVLTYPWINPFSWFVSPSVFPWIAALACGAVAWGVVAARTIAWTDGPRVTGWQGARWLGVWLALFLAAIVWRTPHWNAELFLAIAAVALLAVSIDIGGRAASNAPLFRVIAVAWLLAAGINSLITLFQYFDWARYLDPLMNQAPPVDPYGNLRQRNQLATLTNIGVACLIWGFNPGNASDTLSEQTHQGWGRWHHLGAKHHRWISWALLVLMVSACAVSRSRTGAIELVLVALLAVCWRKRMGVSGARMAMAVPVVFVVAALGLPYVAYAVTGVMPPNMFDRLSGAAAAAGSCQSRVWLYQNVIDLTLQKPWLGWGWQELEFAHYIAQLDNRFCEILDNAHNLPLHLAVELGIPLALVLTLIPFWMFIKNKPWNYLSHQQHLAFSVIIVIGIHSMFEYPLWYGPFVIAFGLSLGILWPGIQKSPATEVVFRQFLAVRIFSIVLVLVVGSWVGWGYYRVLQLFSGETAGWSAAMLKGTWELKSNIFYKRQIDFYQFLTTPLTPENAMERFNMGGELLHYSTDKRIVSAQINAAEMAGIDRYFIDIMMVRFKTKYPRDYQYFITGKMPN